MISWPCKSWTEFLLFGGFSPSDIEISSVDLQGVYQNMGRWPVSNRIKLALPLFDSTFYCQVRKLSTIIMHNVDAFKSSETCCHWFCFKAQGLCRIRYICPGVTSTALGGKTETLILLGNSLCLLNAYLRNQVDKSLPSQHHN